MGNWIDGEVCLHSCYPPLSCPSSFPKSPCASIHTGPDRDGPPFATGPLNLTLTVAADSFPNEGMNKLIGSTEFVSSHVLFSCKSGALPVSIAFPIKSGFSSSTSRLSRKFGLPHMIPMKVHGVVPRTRASFC